MMSLTILICVVSSITGVKPAGPPNTTHSSGLLLMAETQLCEVASHLGEMMLAVQEVFCFTWKSKAREGH